VMIACKAWVNQGNKVDLARGGKIYFYHSSKAK
jgi:hypothetical protein